MADINSELDLFLWFQKKWGEKLSSSDITYIAKTLWPLINNKNSSWINIEEYARRHPYYEDKDSQHG